MVDLFRPGPGAHTSRQELLRSRIDHPIFLRNEIPGGFFPPCWLWCLFLNACEGDGTLRRRKERGLLGRSVLTKRGAKSIVRHPQETVLVGSQLRRLRMRLFPIKYLSDGFAFVRRQSRNEDQGLDSFVDTRSYHGPGIGMRRENDRPFGPLQRAFKRSDIIRK